jgi:hypothetical protein
VTWSNKYKKSIDCGSPKGFSQKAHCQARKLRQMGKKTKSKPVNEDVGMVGGSPINNVAGGQIAGLGVGPQGEPGVKKRKTATFISFIKRKSNVAS